ncbi:MAG: sulfite exporter TauE/SafE family protein [Methylococcales bacterium]|nr:sulfite exporter TauE/SafE family protein [Methylococcales bacterium]MBT7410476.1 sulfite exporter TauE/SafE family protein [Methylococcales bacterium]
MPMPEEITFVAAFLIGLFGSIHCAGMCGGVVGLLTIGLDTKEKKSWKKTLPYLLCYNSGRIFSYMIAGGLLGLVGSAATMHLSHQHGHSINLWVSSLFLIALGLYLANIWPVLQYLEKVGAKLWKIIEPFGRQILPINNLLHAFVLGGVWGWLPCGLVYSVLGWSLMASSWWHGSLLMLFFGLGTLPMLISMGSATQWLTKMTQAMMVRRVIGIGMIVTGVVLILLSMMKG